MSRDARHALTAKIVVMLLSVLASVAALGVVAWLGPERVFAEAKFAVSGLFFAAMVWCGQVYFRLRELPAGKDLNNQQRDRVAARVTKRTVTLRVLIVFLALIGAVGVCFDVIGRWLPDYRGPIMMVVASLTGVLVYASLVAFIWHEEIAEFLTALQADIRAKQEREDALKRLPPLKADAFANDEHLKGYNTVLDVTPLKSPDDEPPTAG